MIALIGKVLLYFIVFQIFLFVLRFIIGIGTAYKVTKNSGKTFSRGGFGQSSNHSRKPGQKNSPGDDGTIIEAEYKVID
ncbi:hypothetical protein N9N67_07490 [Bacteriovoracaceae bacterium]|nr:hypothetical protein [Bacteriovoracaceae bacterium]